MKIVKSALPICLLLFLSIISLLSAKEQLTEMKKFSIDDMGGVITKKGVQIDRENSSDGKGSLKSTAAEPTVIRLFDIQDLHIDNATLVYEAKVHTKDVQGTVYLEMWCVFKNKGEYFSRGLDHTLSGTTGWTTLRTPFFLKKGESPDKVKLNLVINGKGTAWIDNIRLLKAPLPKQ